MQAGVPAVEGSTVEPYAKPELMAEPAVARQELGVEDRRHELG